MLKETRLNGTRKDIEKGEETCLARRARLPKRNTPVETAAVVVLIAVLFGGLTLLLRPRAESPRDFFQDYVSARNLLSGRPIYPRMDQAIYEYTGRRTTVRVTYNAHPPTSVLLALPFAGMAYVPAAVAWSLLSLVLLAGSLAVLISELRFDISLRHLVLLAAVLGLWPPLWEHLGQGQLSIPILFLLTLAWREARRGRDTLASCLLGLATAIKVFPAALIVYLVFRLRFRLAIASAIWFMAISGVTVLITGPGAFLDYLTLVLPALKHWNGYGQNLSLTGFFNRLSGPPLATVMVLIASGFIAAAVWKASKRADFDGGFAMAITGTLLVTTLTWPHSLVILLLPLAVYGARLAQAGSLSRWLAGAGWLLMAVPQPFLPGFPGFERASVVVNLTVLSLNFYGLLAFFLAQARLRRTCQLDGPESSRIYKAEPVQLQQDSGPRHGGV